VFTTDMGSLMFWGVIVARGADENIADGAWAINILFSGASCGWQVHMFSIELSIVSSNWSWSGCSSRHQCRPMMYTVHLNSKHCTSIAQHCKWQRRLSKDGISVSRSCCTYSENVVAGGDWVYNFKCKLVFCSWWCLAVWSQVIVPMLLHEILLHSSVYPPGAMGLINPVICLN
jgi:hypothetical protein